MQIYSGAGSNMMLPAAPPPPPLPLNVLLNHVDSSGTRDLHTLFLDFASRVYQSANFANPNLDFSYNPPSYPDITSGLCRMIYNGWLTQIVTSSTTVTGTTSSYLTSVPDTPSLISRLQTVLTAPGCKLYVLIGMYHFVIWYLCTKTGTFGEIDNQVTDYIRQQLLTHKYVDKSLPASSRDNVVLIPISIFSFKSTFASAFKPSDSLKQFEYSMRFLLLDHLEFQNSGVKLSNFTSASPNRKLATQQALCSFIRESRRLLAEVVNAETRELLRAIKPELADDYKHTTILAVGQGEISYGFFGVHNMGILFFDYELRGNTSLTFNPGAPSTAALTYLGVEKKGSRKILGSEASTVFLAHVGVDQPFSTLFSSTTAIPARRALTPHINVKRSSTGSLSIDNLHVIHNGTSRFEPGGTSVLYNPTDSSISLNDLETLDLEFRTNTNVREDNSVVLSGGNLMEELAFFVMPNKVPAVPAAAVAKANWLLGDNQFFDPAKVGDVFQDDLVNLEALMSVLMSDEEFEVKATLRGDGIGVAADPGSGLPEGTIVKSSSQKDTKTASAHDEHERHARGTVSYFKGPAERLLRFDVLGFSSDLRCSWATKYPYGATAYLDMYSSVGQYVIKDDKDYKGGPWYNGALSSFRAFGLLKAMIKAIEDRAQVVLSPSRYTTVKNKLDMYLSTEAGVRIANTRNLWVQKTTPALIPGSAAEVKELIVNNTMFDDVQS